MSANIREHSLSGGIDVIFTEGTMKYSKIALIGASSFAMFGASYAADLPSRKSSPVDYVKVCDAYGAGFFYIPGTDTCLKIGGRVRVEALYSPAENSFRTRSVGGAGNASAVVRKGAQDESGWRSRGWVTLDARTQSAWGTIQTVSSIYLTTAAGISTGANNYTTGAFLSGNTPSATLERAYIRFAGFTFGRANQNFATMPPFTLNTSYWTGFATGNMQVAYTALLGGGISATLALEDNNGFASSTATNLVGAPAPVVSRGPQRAPALVGNVRIDQPWGAFQLSGAVKQQRALIGTGVGQFEVDKVGWAIGGYARINLPMIAAGDRLDLTAAYGDGFMELVISTGLNATTTKIGRQTGGILRADRDLTVNGAGLAEQTKGWSVGGVFTHYWRPNIRQHSALSYVRITPDSATRATDILAGGLGRANGVTASSYLVWSPVRGFDLGVELAYMRLNDRTLDGTGILAANGVDRNPDSWVGRFRAERQF